ncbi:lipocalin family protein [Xanthomonadaceae bacterium JHOS43]|nr:lipocalin family protein [Xanthomonadaceae bacterium JHOS43]
MSRLAVFAGVAAAALIGCSHQLPAVKPVPRVDIERYMGDWYVIAHIPSRPEREAFNAVESYALDAKGRVQTTFRFRKGSFDAPLETMRPVGFVRPGTGNAVWGMRFVWPIKAEFVITYLDPDYRTTIVARSKRDYAWIMARTPQLDEVQYEALVQALVDIGYARDSVRKVPQQWPESRNDRSFGAGLAE